MSASVVSSNTWVGGNHPTQGITNSYPYIWPSFLSLSLPLLHSHTLSLSLSQAHIHILTVLISFFSFINFLYHFYHIFLFFSLSFIHSFSLYYVHLGWKDEEHAPPVVHENFSFFSYFTSNLNFLSDTEPKKSFNTDPVTEYGDELTYVKATTNKDPAEHENIKSSTEEKMRNMAVLLEEDLKKDAQKVFFSLSLHPFSSAFILTPFFLFLLHYLLLGFYLLFQSTSYG